MTRILMVCLGNICRSPLAEGILKSKLPKSKFEINSAGTANYHLGKAPDLRSIKIARKHQIDISKQKSRQFVVSDFDTYDLIFAMDTSNYNNILALSRFNTDKKKVKLILNESFPGKNINVPDPYYGGEDGFNNVYNMLENACDILSKKLLNDEKTR